MEWSETLVKIENLEVSYDQIVALKGVSLEVKRGEIVALLGPNGAGKTTIMETILGVTQPAAGRIIFKDEDITQSAVDRNVRLGISLVPEERGVFFSLSVVDNLLLGAHHNIRKASGKMDGVFDLFPVLGERKGQLAGTLSGGERRMLAIARALMSSPEIILMDEPSIGLAPMLVDAIFDTLVNLNREGYTILLAEQNFCKALGTAHRGCIMEAGNIVSEGSSQELLGNPSIAETYLGV